MLSVAKRGRVQMRHLYNPSPLSLPRAPRGQARQHCHALEADLSDQLPNPAISFFPCLPTLPEPPVTLRALRSRNLPFLLLFSSFSAAMTSKNITKRGNPLASVRAQSGLGPLDRQDLLAQSSTSVRLPFARAKPGLCCPLFAPSAPTDTPARSGNALLRHIPAVQVLTTAVREESLSRAPRNDD